ncbi:MAG: sulfur carrier protein ThiS [Gemmatimonadota bacterium]|nr:sulfur carrier protein ThiS [Gemmatimonadota bacterium]
MSEISIEVNGRSRTVEEGATLIELLKGLGLDGRTVVVELNRQIVRRTELADTRLEPGDRLELVHFVGGG